MVEGRAGIWRRHVGGFGDWPWSISLLGLQLHSYVYFVVGLYTCNLCSLLCISYFNKSSIREAFVGFSLWIPFAFPSYYFLDLHTTLLTSASSRRSSDNYQRY